MKATGIVRRIDDLGRIVVPKEIRRTLRLREGTPLEIFTDREGEIILKKYSPMVELTAFAGQYAEAMSQSTGLMVCITDRDQVIAVAGGPKKDILQKNISRQLEQLINERQSVCAGKDEKNFIPLVAEELEGVTAQVVTAIICEGDAIGAVAILSREPRARFGEMEMKLASTAAGFLGSHICDTLLERGDAVRALVLPGDKSVKYIPNEVDIVEGNLCDADSLDRKSVV